MPIKVTCPKCQGVLHAPDDAGGKRGKCPTCGTVLAIPAAGIAAPPPPPPPVTSTAVPVGGGKPLGEAGGYGLMPPSAGEVRQSSVPMLPRPGEAAKPAAGFGSPPPRPAAVKPPKGADAAAAEVTGYRRARRGLGLAQVGQFFLLLAGLAGPGVAIARHYGVKLPDMDPGYLKKPGLTALTEIEFGSVLVPLAVGLLLLVLGRVGFGNLPRSSYARGPAKWGGLFALLAAAGLVTYLVVTANALFTGLKPFVWADGVPRPQFLQFDDLTGKLQIGGLVGFVAFAVLAEVFFVSAVGRLGANLRSDVAAGRHTRFLLLTHLFAAAGLGWLLFRYVLMTQDGSQWPGVWNGVAATWDDLMGKTGAARPVVGYGLMAAPTLVGWWLYARLTGGGRRAIGDWLAAHG